MSTKENNYGVTADDMRPGKFFWHESSGTGLIVSVNGIAYTTFLLGGNANQGVMEGGDLQFIEEITPYDVSHAMRALQRFNPNAIRHRFGNLRRRAKLPHGYRFDVIYEAGTAWPVGFQCNCVDYGCDVHQVDDTVPRWRGIRAAARAAMADTAKAVSFEDDWKREETRRMEAEQLADRFLTEKNQAEAEVRRLEHRIDSITGEYGFNEQQADGLKPAAETLGTLPDHAMLFKIVDGEPVPHFRRDDDRPDGMALLTISQMVDRCGHDEAHWVDHWRKSITFADLPAVNITKGLDSADYVQRLRRGEDPHEPAGPAMPNGEPAADDQADPELRIGSIVSHNSMDLISVVTHIDGNAFIGLGVASGGLELGINYGWEMTDVDQIGPLTVFEVADRLRAKAQAETPVAETHTASVT